MEEKKDQIEALHDIRRMMQNSSKFLSLSGFSGVLAGVYAIAGVLVVNKQITDYLKSLDSSGDGYQTLVIRIVGICIIVVALSLTTVLILSYRKAAKNNQRLVDHTSKKLLESISMPMVAGGLFCLALLLHNLVGFIPSAMLLFYGMALVNSSKFTLSDIKSLGYLIVGLGVMASFYPELGLTLWGIGFGILHILYGTIVWFKYDR